MNRRVRTALLKPYWLPVVLVSLVASAMLLLSELDEGTSRASMANNHVAVGTVGHRAGAGRSAVPSTLPATASIDLGGQTSSVPSSFLGVSTEYWAFPQYARQMELLPRVLSLLQVPRDGPMILRIGGDSADHALWDPGVRTVAPWMFTLTPAWLQEARWLVQHLHVRLILDLNLVTSSPLAAAEWARQTEAFLPRGSIAGFEIGNEPDLYSRRFWLETVSPTSLDATFVPVNLAPRTYTRDFRSYADLLAHVAPGAPLFGPAVANSVLDSRWISRLLAAPHPRLGTVTGHWYPYSGCARLRSPMFPTINRLLSENATAGMARGARRVVRLTRSHGLPFRLTEFNSVTCGGRAGVSDTFATALWAPDALFELIRAGVEGVNLHIRAHTINAPFTLNRGGLDARPFLYGLIMFARALGADAKLIPVSLEASRALHLKVWAVRVAGDILHVLLIDKSSYSARVDLRLPAAGAATVQRLQAPSAGSRSGVTLAGQHLSRAGYWIGRPRGETIVPSTSGYQVTVPRLSEALVTVRIRSGPVTASRPRAAVERRWSATGAWQRAAIRTSAESRHPRTAGRASARVDMRGGGSRSRAAEDSRGGS